ncbi:MAG TPA: hypothetical protein VD837_19435 [Terriglobales bacterium]|nr:hypothetical protein [Terriglobales bacterium]
MYTHFYINREWMLSRTARRVYRAAAALSFGLLALIVAHFAGADLLDQPLVAPLVGPVLLLCMLGTALTLVAMEYFYFTFDDLSTFRKVAWFFILCLIPIGPALYCYAVYSRSKYFQMETHPAANVPTL